MKTPELTPVAGLYFLKGSPKDRRESYGLGAIDPAPVQIANGWEYVGNVYLSEDIANLINYLKEVCDKQKEELESLKKQHATLTTGRRDLLAEETKEALYKYLITDETDFHSFEEAFRKEKRRLTDETSKKD